MLRRLLCMIILVILWIGSADCQSTIPISYVPKIVLEQVEGLPAELDSNDYELVLESIKVMAQNQGYLAASVDSFEFQDDLIEVYLFLAKKLRIESILVDSFMEFNQSQWSDENPVVLNQYKWKESEKILNKLANQGFPLAFFSKKKTQLDSNQLRFEWNLSKGPLVRFGDIILKDSSVVSKHYLEPLLKIKKGAMFRIASVEEISTKLSKRDFITLKEAPKVVLVGTQADIHLNLAPRYVSVFNFLLGVLPSNVDGNQKFTISGELTAHFKNKLKYGEELYVHFNQLKKEKQRIEFAAKYPYLFKTPIGVSTEFQLFRNEKSTIDQLFQLGATYDVSKSQETTFYTEFSSSRLLNIDTSQIKKTKALPTNLDVNNVNIGIKAVWDQLDEPLNPRSGWSIASDVSMGRRTIIPNNSIKQISVEEVDFSKAYDSLAASSIKIQIEWQVKRFFPIRKRSTLLLQNHSAAAWSSSPLLVNEYYRLGGSKSIRGFDDQSLVALFLNYLTAEYRYLLGESAYISTFVDYGYLYNPRLDNNRWNSLLGFGAGLSFQVPAGVFSIEFAVGKRGKNPIDFRNTKSHIGFITLF